jgi:Secretion system C-terminal sorting domain
MIFIWSNFSAQDTHDISSKTKNMAVFNVATGQFEKGPFVNYQSEVGQSPNDFDFDCNQEFWSITEAGEIQEWSLVNGIISGGEIVLTNAGNGVALCNISAPTFYTTNYPDSEIRYYDPQNGWMTIPTSDPVLNNGCYGDDQFYMGVVFDPDLNFHVNRILYYFNGTSLEILEELQSDFFTVADISVDGLGRAWIFRGDGLASVKSLEVYSSTGHLMSFNIEFNSIGAYGSFFLNNRLHIGIEDSIVPIIIIGENAELGTPISFPNNQPNYVDLASCQDSSPLSIVDFEFYENELVLIPNPTSDVVKIPDHIDITLVEVISLNGQKVRTIKKNNSINLAGLPNGIYILKIFTENGSVNRKIIKK